jgi:hypothetical protein
MIRDVTGVSSSIAKSGVGFYRVWLLRRLGTRAALRFSCASLVPRTMSARKRFIHWLSMHKARLTGRAVSLKTNRPDTAPRRAVRLPLIRLSRAPSCREKEQL